MPRNYNTRLSAQCKLTLDQKKWTMTENRNLTKYLEPLQFNFNAENMKGEHPNIMIDKDLKSGLETGASARNQTIKSLSCKQRSLQKCHNEDRVYWKRVSW